MWVNVLKAMGQKRVYSMYVCIEGRRIVGQERQPRVLCFQLDNYFLLKIVFNGINQCQLTFRKKYHHVDDPEFESAVPAKGGQVLRNVDWTVAKRLRPYLIWYKNDNDPNNKTVWEEKKFGVWEKSLPYIVGKTSTHCFYLDFNYPIFNCNRSQMMNMAEKFERQKYCDIEFYCRGSQEPLGAHKVFLSSANSQVFDDMFRKDETERMFYIPISRQVFKQLLLFIYTSEAPDLCEESITLPLFEAAATYGFYALQVECMEVLIDKLNADNALKIFAWSNFPPLGNLPSCKLRDAICRAALQTVVQYSPYIFCQPLWKDMIIENPTLCTRVIEIMGKKLSPTQSEKKIYPTKAGFSTQNDSRLANFLPHLPGAQKNRPTDGLIDFFNGQKFCDIFFRFPVQDEPGFGAHRVVLSAGNAYFASMLQAGWKETKTGQVDIVDTEPAVFKQIITYIYTGQIPELKNESVVKDLYVAADKYLIDPLRMKCLRFLLKRLDVSNVLSLIVWSDLFLVQNIFDIALDFAIVHFNELPKYHYEEPLFARNHPDLFLRLTRKMAEKINRVKK